MSFPVCAVCALILFIILSAALKMASGLVRGAISVVLNDDKLVKATKTDNMRLFGQTFCSKIMESDRELDLFDKFCVQFVHDIDKIFSTMSKRIRSPTTKRTRAWTSFHREREKNLPQLWHNLFSSLKLEDNSFFAQSINQELFQQRLVEFLSPAGILSKSTSYDEVEFTVDDLNILRYACGYVPYSLLKKFEKLQGAKAGCFVDCLGTMAVVGEGSDLLSYTKLWIEKIDRGGLFPINDETFYFFTEIERIVRVLLPKHVVSTSSLDGIDSIIEKVQLEDDIQFQWTLISQDVDSDEESQELLYEIVKKWITVRGHSIASTWIELYKQATKETTSKSTGLRKHLS